MRRRARRIPALVAALASALCAPGCGGAPSPGAPEELVAPEAPRPRNAAAIAQAISGAQVSALVYVDRTRGHPVGERVAGLDLWSAVLEGTGIDPRRDLERVFVSSQSVTSGDKTIAIAEHTLPSERIEAALEARIARSVPPGRWLDGLGVRAAEISVRGQTRVVAIVEPSFLVVLPTERAAEAARFVGTGGFPDPTGPEAAVAYAVDPSKTLRAPHVPKFPKTLRSATARVILSADGGADVEIDAASTDAEQAKRDAQKLTETVERATTLRLGIIKVRLFKPVKFRAEGGEVRSKVHLGPSEIDQLFGLLAAVLPR